MPEEVVRTPVGYKTIETGGAPARVVFPVFDEQLDGNPPRLAYQIFPGDDSASITILGRNLTGIVAVGIAGLRATVFNLHAKRRAPLCPM